jgi:D-Tyr-tRNAtyr deacylase
MPRFNVHRADYTYAPDEPELMIPAGFALWANTRKGTRPSGPAFPYSGFALWANTRKGTRPSGPAFPYSGFALWANTRKGTRPSGPAFPYSRPAVAIFPDSDKVGVWANGDEGGAVIAPRSTTVEYWHGEA